MRNIKVDGLLLRPAIDLVYAAALMVVLTYFGVASWDHPIEIGVLYAFVNYLDRFFEPVNQIMMRLSLYSNRPSSLRTGCSPCLDEKELNPSQSKRRT